MQTERRGTRTIQRCLRAACRKLILSWDEKHELYDLNADPEEVLNLFNVPREDKHRQFDHFENQSATIVELAGRMLTRATELEDFAGIELAGRVLRQQSALSG